MEQFSSEANDVVQHIDSEFAADMSSKSIVVRMLAVINV